MLKKFWLRDAAMLSAAALIGWWAHGAHTVKAETQEALPFIIGNINPNSGLSIYYPGEHTFYVYQGIAAGNASLQCAYKFTVGQPGSQLRRDVCPAGRLLQ